jgi:hypothetical protein
MSGVDPINPTTSTSSENQKPKLKTTTVEDSKPSTNTMDKVNSSVLRNSIDGIPLLTSDNYTHWRQRVVNFLDLIDLKDAVASTKDTLLASDNKLLKSVFVSKLDAAVQANVVTAENENNAQLIWKSITNFFASNQSSNKARVFRAFLRSPYTPNDIAGFITTMKSFEARLIEVGWSLPADSLGHLVMDKFPSNMDNIADMITHSGKDITINAVVNHLCLHADNQELRASGSGTRSNPITLFTDTTNKRCKRGAHNTAATHTEANCWKLYPEKRDEHMRLQGSPSSKTETTVSSFHSSLS